MYKKALQEGYVYPSTRGNITTQDLFTMHLDGNSGFNLNSVYVTLEEMLEKAPKKSLLSQSVDTTYIQNRIDIVKDIAADKIAEKNSKLKAKENKAKREHILQILASKQDDALKSKTEEELLKELEALD